MASDSRAICTECGHVRAWHDREAARSMRSGELASDRRCYREIGGAGCRCSGFRDSGELAMLLVVVGLALLYAYRSQGPAVPPVSYTEAVQEINAGRVSKVTIVANRATLDLRTGEKQQLALPDRPEVCQKLLDDYNAANPSRPMVIEYQAESAPFTVIASILLSLLPVLLLGAFFLYSMSRVRPR
jgi:ATP-dependent Zn protease